MPTSGNTALTNSDDTVPTDAIAANIIQNERKLQIVNTGATALQFRVGTGDWHYFPASYAMVYDFDNLKDARIQIRKIPSGSNVTGVFVDVL